MQTKPPVDSVNGSPRNVYADLEAHVRRNAELPLPPLCPGFHSFLDTAKGVIHVGGHVGQERNIYGDLPVVWIEAIPMVFNVLLEKIADKPNQRALNVLVADGKPHKFGFASNACQSSSIFDLKGHKEIWPHVGYVAAKEMQSVTLANVIDTHSLDLNTYDTLVMDVQGAELLVLQGAGDCLKRFRWIMAEAADFEAYAGGCQLADLDAYLMPLGFIRDRSNCAASNDNVGSYYDVVYFNNRPVENAVTVTDDSVRLNLGAGAFPLQGFVNIDRKTGGEVYPLAYADGSVDEIVASHILEHFGHRETSLVLQDWVRALRPGGKISIAVPNFEEVATLYLKGAAVNVQGYVMGGHNDADDRHGCIFDRESLTELMMCCGLERIGAWDAVATGCAAGPHTLNLQGFKPVGPESKVQGIRAVLSTPRFGPLMHPRCAERAFHQLGIEARSTSSCYWAQQISVLMERAIAFEDCEFVLTMDFDTIFSASDVIELYRLLKACPEVDAVIPMQSKRGCDEMLMSVAAKTPGMVRAAISEADLRRNLLPANTGHFGLTLFRAESLRKFPRPWMVPKPNSEGRWDTGQTDADIDFWRRFRDAGFKACLAPRVVVGHLEEVIKWPGMDLKPVYQTAADYDENGIPAAVKR